MPLPLHALSSVLCCTLALLPFRGTSAQSSFRTSLTATVSRLAADGAEAKPGPPGCRRVALHWNALPAARRYVVYVSNTRDGPWGVLPARNACGASSSAGPTSVIDVEHSGTPRGGARRIYYKVAALAGDGADERALDTTTVVSVELP